LYRGEKEAAEPIHLRVVEAQENHTKQLKRYTDALEEQARENTPIQRALSAAFDHKTVTALPVHKEETPLPDLPIQDLFSHIDPEFLTRTDEAVGDRWDVVGDQIRDRAALGALKIWGRPVRDGVDRLLGQREALRLIEAPYWTTSFFTYSFFDSTSGDAPHTYLQFGHSGEQYTDLQVNRKEAYRLWPEKNK
jgi:hypothetical protein